MESEPVMVNHALGYAKKKIAVFPIWEPCGGACTCGNPDCGSPAKHPVEHLAPRGCLDATLNEQIIRKWWIARPNANIGILCGGEIFVVDVDPKHGGSESLAQIEAQFGELPSSVRVRTGGDGEHIYLKTAGAAVKGRIGMRPGIDIKSKGGYVVAPPSIHISGKRYQFIPSEHRGLDSAPEWLLKQINGDSQKPRFDVASALKGVPHGKRYSTLLSLAGKMRRADVPFEEALELILKCAANCTPPAPVEDSRRILEKAYRTWQAEIYPEAPPMEAEREPINPVEIKTLAQATTEYIEKIKTSQGAKYVTTGIASLDYAVGGGIDHGEMCIVAARPSHGKSAFALHLLDASAKANIPTAIVSEEMSSLMLGKRTIQYASHIAEYRWIAQIDELENQIDKHFAERAPCYVIERCKTSDRTAEAVMEVVKNNGVKVVAVDYAQLLGSKGKSRYEMITQTSITLRQLASNSKIALVVLCQLNREIESRDKFIPRLDDLKDSGQLEQDADLVLSLVWPWHLDSNKSKNDYQIWVNKNRNREIVSPMVQCGFDPSRQIFSVNYHQDSSVAYPARWHSYND